MQYQWVWEKVNKNDITYIGRVMIGGLVLISPLFLSSPSISPPASLHKWYTSCSGLTKQTTLFSSLHFKSLLKKTSQLTRLEHMLSITFRKEDLLPHRHLFKRKAKSIGWPTGTPQYAGCMEVLWLPVSRMRWIILSRTFCENRTITIS